MRRVAYVISVLQMVLLCSCCQIKQRTEIVGYTNVEDTINVVDSVEYYFRSISTKDDSIVHVSTPEVALELAKVVITEICDNHKAILRPPYSVNLVDDSYWVVLGDLFDRTSDGDLRKIGYFLIEIDKKSGEIRKVEHDFFL